jgi:very-short-patch-repair endonuclease
MKNSRNWTEVQKYYDDNHSSREVIKYFKMSNITFLKAVRDGKIVTRSKSDATRLAAVKYPRIPTDEQNKKRSNSMKKAHADGRAWNIGRSRWNNEPSWPEQWFIRVISNEFNDKKYEREYPFHRFSLDFVWLHKKRVIEIDGEQHDRFSDQKERDRSKDELLAADGYAILRVRWKDICNDAKGAIQQMKEFIDL